MQNADLKACAAVEKELDRVISKFTEIRDNAAAEISDVANLMEELLKVINKAEQEMTGTFDTSTQVDVPTDVDVPMTDEVEMEAEMKPTLVRFTDSQVKYITDTLQEANKKLKHLSAEHRVLHGAISKVGKAIDRNFVSDFTAITGVDAFQSDENMVLLNKAIAEHYCRQGMDDVARLLIKESRMPDDMAQEVLNSESNFAEIYRIWKEIQQQQLGTALEWATRYSADLIAKNSILEFKLHRLAFLQIMSRGIDAQAEALAYARKNVIKFVDRFEQEISKLMGCFIYLPMGIDKSPYKHLISPEVWLEVSYVFLKDACLALGISKNSALSVVINVGCTALPALLNITQVMPREILRGWNARDELPINIELDPEYRYHSIFVCPILQQQTSEENPPQKLTCGHVISKIALRQLTHRGMLKCPLCPVEQNADEAMQIYF